MNREKLEEARSMCIAGGYTVTKIIIDAILEDEPIKEEIRPKAGELWAEESTGECFIYNPGDNRLRRIWESGNLGFVESTMIHGRYGWRRLYPPVEEK